MRSHILEFIHQTGFALKVPFAPKVGKKWNFSCKAHQMCKFYIFNFIFLFTCSFLLFGNTIVLFIFARLIEAEKFDFCPLFLIK